MLTIEVELLFGTYRADPEGTAHTGNLTRGEWPPSVSRLFAALVAADGTGERSRHTTGEELLWLEAQSPPTIEASGFDDVAHSPVRPRFVVRQDEGYFKPTKAEQRGQVTTAQEHVGRTAAEVRPGVRVSPRHAVVRFIWPSEPPDKVLRGLRLRSARVGYLGCADTPVRISVASKPGEPEAPPDKAVPDRHLGRFSPSIDGSGEVLIGGIEPGTTGRLDAHFERWLEGGPNVRRAHSPGLRRLVRYTGPDSDAVETGEQPLTLWFRVEHAVGGRRVLAFTQALRAALLSRYDAEFGEPPGLLHGHGFSGKGHDTARYLALPNVGGRRSDGRIHGAAIWFPPGTETRLVESCRQALAGLVELRTPYGRSELRFHGGESRPWAASPARWTAPSRRWVTAFPAVHERSRRRIDLAEVGRWCEHSGLPQPVAFRQSRAPLLPGALDLAPPEVNRPGRPVRRYSHFEVVFDTEVRGPVAIGAARQFGLGLLAPVDEGPSNG